MSQPGLHMVCPLGSGRFALRYPFLIWAAAFFVIPAMGLAMGMLWAASMIGS